MSSGFSPPGIDGGTFTGSNTQLGPWSSNLSFAAGQNSSSVTQNVFVSSSSITASGSIGTVWASLPSMTDLFYDNLSRLEVRFEVTSRVRVEFHASVNPELTGAAYAGLLRVAGPALAQANYYLSALNASFIGELAPGVYRVYADCPYTNSTRAGHSWTSGFGLSLTATTLCGSSDFNGDDDFGTDDDILAFFACLAGNCCPSCGSADFNADGDTGTDADIEAFFRALAGGAC